MRFLVCGSEIANNMHAFTQALRKSGLDATSCCLVRNQFYKENIYDYDISSPPAIKNKYLRRLATSLRKIKTFSKLAWKYDCYVYIWHITFLPLKLDLLLLKALGKKVFVFHCGDDVRYRPIQSRIDRFIFNVNYFDPAETEEIRKYESGGITFFHAFFNQRLTETWGATIISLRSQATFQNKPAFFFKFPQPSLLAEPKNPNPTPLIVHAPTDRSGKGTKYVLSAIEALKQEGLKFDFELIEKKSNDYLLERLIKADILIDQPGPWFGKLGAEALAAGCAVISGNKAAYYGIENNSPVIQFEPDHEILKESVRRLLKNKSELSSTMKSSFFYWEKNYSEKAFSEYLEGIISGSKFLQFRPMENHKSIVYGFSENTLQRIFIALFLTR